MPTTAYNAFGQRMRKSDNTLTTGHRFYAYDEAGRVLGEYDGTGKALEEYVYLDGHRPVAVARNLGLTQTPVVYPILTDHLGTPRKILNPAGSLVWSWDAKDPYGYQAPNELESGTVFTFDLRFPGQRYDKQTGLFHNGFRDYDSKLGRYVQADPIGLEGGWNHYTYAGADPIQKYDFFGLKFGEGFNHPAVQQAIAYLHKSSWARDALNTIQKSKTSVNIKITEDSGTFNPSTNTVEWNPAESIYCKVTKDGISPAVVLIHELFHFIQRDAQPELSRKMRATPNPEMGTTREGVVSNDLERVAIGFENMVARELGELVRDSHYSLRTPGSQQRQVIKVKSVTGRKPGE